MKHVTTILTLLIVTFLSACNEKKIVTEKEVEAYIKEMPAHPAILKQVDDDLNFWQGRLTERPDATSAQIKVAGLLIKRFQYTGNIMQLHEADSLYQLANGLIKQNGSSVYRALAANAITQHQFLKAKNYLDSAYNLGDDKYLTILMQFDVAIELGNYALAEKKLLVLKKDNDFDYLIRAAKYQDHVKGNLENAIAFMEAAVQKISTNNTGLYCWAKSNLADMYGHANRFEDAYKNYLDVLQKDSAYYHCLKGIAWLSFSHDKNTVLATKILIALKKVHPIADYDLLLAEIAAFENDSINSTVLINQYYKQTSNYLYGDMYKRYHFNLQADAFGNYQSALELATEEVRSRPTAASYDLLAWAYYKKGAINKAVQILQSNVENRVFEPGVLYHMGVIYKAAGNKKKAKKYLKEAAEAAYELGPVLSKEITKELGII